MTRLLPILFLLFLSACGGLSQPFGKAEAPTNVPTIVAPPWEAMVAAGPGAANDIDFETLNGPGKAPPEVTAAETTDARPGESTAGKLVIKAVAVVPVKGAKGEGNEDLTNAMRQTLTATGWKVLGAPAKNALTIAGQVEMAQASGKVQKVTLKWVVQLPDGQKLGEVKQANNVSAGSLDGGWGENAGFAAEAAATGIFDLINKFR